MGFSIFHGLGGLSKESCWSLVQGMAYGRVYFSVLVLQGVLVVVGNFAAFHQINMWTATSSSLLVTCLLFLLPLFT